MATVYRLSYIANSSFSGEYGKGVVLFLPYFHDDSQPQFLIAKRQEDRDQLPGLWCMMGGKLEPDETWLQAATREYSQEVGHRPRALIPFAHFLDDGIEYLVFLSPTDKPYFNPSTHPGFSIEHSDHVWTSLDDLPDHMYSTAKIFLETQKRELKLAAKNPRNLEIELLL